MTALLDREMDGYGRAIVIGGGMAGLLVARVLATHYERVTIVERDYFPAKPSPRGGVPQGRHVHVLLTRGYQLLERMFPGLDAELAAAGVPLVDWLADAPSLAFAGWVPRQHSQLRTRICSRPLLEWLVYRGLTERPQVHVLEGMQVTGLISTPDRKRVVGVRMHRRGPSATEQAEELRAELIVDASGRTSRTPEWIESLGYSRPNENVINARVGYATRYYQRPVPPVGDWQGLLLSYKAPDKTRAGVVWPIEGGRWVVTLAGVAGDYPPLDEEGFLAFARSLRSPILYDAVKDASPLTPIYGYRRTENQRRYYERLARWPEGFIVIGDAVCALNPVYGQGMTVAALSATALGRSLRARRSHGRSTVGLAREVQRRLGRVVAMPWLMATGEDYRWPTTAGKRPTIFTRLLYRYVDQILYLSTRNLDTARTFGNVWHLLQSPIVLARPRILLQVARHIFP